MYTLLSTKNWLLFMRIFTRFRHRILTLGSYFIDFSQSQLELKGFGFFYARTATSFLLSRDYRLDCLPAGCEIMQNGGWWWGKSISPFDHFGISGGVHLVVILVWDLSILRAKKAWFTFEYVIQCTTLISIFIHREICGSSILRARLNWNVITFQLDP